MARRNSLSVASLRRVRWQSVLLRIADLSLLLVCGFAWAAQDTDGDGVDDSVDNCKFVANPTQTDADLDGKGDACDNCINNPNPGQQDGDNDAVGDACDNCPSNSNATQTGHRSRRQGGCLRQLPCRLQRAADRHRR